MRTRVRFWAEADAVATEAVTIGSLTAGLGLRLGPGPALAWAQAQLRPMRGLGRVLVWAMLWLDSGLDLGPALAWSHIWKLNTNYRLAEVDRRPTCLGP